MKSNCATRGIVKSFTAEVISWGFERPCERGVFRRISLKMKGFGMFCFEKSGVESFYLSD